MQENYKFHKTLRIEVDFLFRRRGTDFPTQSLPKLQREPVQEVVLVPIAHCSWPRPFIFSQSIRCPYCTSNFTASIDKPLRSALPHRGSPGFPFPDSAVGRKKRRPFPSKLLQTPGACWASCPLWARNGAPPRTPAFHSNAHATSGFEHAMAIAPFVLCCGRRARVV